MAAQAKGCVSGRYRYVLLALVVLSWAISWPLIKIGVATVPPIWFASIRYLIATLCLFGLLAARGQLGIPSRADWPLIGISGGLQMAAYSALTSSALTRLPPGRASVLAFSTPIWVVPLAARWLGERASPGALVGTGLGLVGILAIAEPSRWIVGDRPLSAYAMLVAASISWAISIVSVRAYRFTAATLALAPWQSLLATSLLLPAALLTEGGPPTIGIGAAGSLAFVGPVATAFAYWGVMEVGRQLQPGALSMALLATPPVGIAFSALILGEPIDRSLVAGAVLIAAGIWLCTRSAKP